MSMSSAAETGGDRLCVGFELVAELIQGLCIWFALELREFRELEVSLAVVDTGRDDHFDNH
jgi:hypothetical protein